MRLRRTPNGSGEDTEPSEQPADVSDEGRVADPGFDPGFTAGSGISIDPGLGSDSESEIDQSAAVGSDMLADSVVLEELSQAFSEEEGAVSAAPVKIPIGGADDLPDAVYLDDEMGREGESGETVFIEDDGTGDALLPKDATSRGIEPRLRQRRIGVRRAESRKRLRWVAVGGAVFLLLAAALAVLGSSLFAVDDVSVQGAVYTDQDALAAVVDDIEGTPVLLVDTLRAEADLEDIPWVEDARVRTQFPNGATIEIRERTAVAAMPGADGLSRILDQEGRVLEVVEGQPVALVWIAGPETLDLTPGEFSSIGYASAASLVTKLTPTVRGRVDSLLVTPDGADLVLLLTSEQGLIRVQFGSAIGDSAQFEKLVRLERKLEDIGDDPVSVIDVSTSEVTVR